MHVPLVGRRGEVRALVDALDAAADGAGSAVVVVGEAGIGKTRLVEALTATGRARDAAVFLGRAEEVEQHRPFGVLADALDLFGGTDPERAALADLLTGVDGEHPWEGANLEFGIARAVLTLVERCCADGPALFVVEDLHWADPATLRCLARLGRAAAGLPLLLVLTTRPAPRHRELGGLLERLADDGARTVPVGPLDAAEVRILTENVLGARTGPDLRGNLARAGGNPLFVLELLATLRGSGGLTQTTDGRTELTATGAPVVPATAILRGLRLLPGHVLDLLGSAAVLGASFTVTDLALLTGRSAADLAAALREALAAGALTEQGERLVFRHELIRDALYTALPRSLREALHRELAAALAAAGRPPIQIAEHVLRGAHSGDGQAVRWLREAATEAGPRAPAVAVELLDHALDLVDPADPVRGPLAADRALALMWSGRAAEGEAACRGLLAEDADPQREGMLRWLLLRSMLIRGRAPEALHEIDRALALGTASDVERAHYCASASFARVMLQEHDAAWQLAERAWRLAEPTGDPHAIVEALHAKAHVRRSEGRLNEGVELALAALAAQRGAPGNPGPRAVTVTAGTMLIGTDQVERGRALLTDGIRLNEYHGAATGVALHRANLADGCYLTGEWDTARAEIAATTALTEDGRPAWPVMTLGILALIAVRRDELTAARDHLAAARAALTGGDGPMNEHRMVLAAALYREASGQRKEGLTELTAAWDRFAARGVGFTFPDLGPELVRRLVPAGRTDKAAEVADAVAECARHNTGIATVRGAALVCRGLAEADQDVLLEAVTAYRAGPQPLPHALACEDAAALLADQNPARARELLEEALALYQRLGAAHYRARTAAALRALGIRRGSPAGRPQTRIGWAALTDTERRVLALVAQRLSNREIAQRMYLSRRTVETHVSHILQKTGLSSRLALAAEAIRRGVEPG